MFAGKNVFTNIGSDKVKRRPSQFDRAVHRLYPEPRPLFSNRLAESLYKRSYWAVRTLQFKIFYRNEELDVEDGGDKWDVGVKPPPLDMLIRQSRFDPRWIKYMYAKFKNVCPSGRMKETEFREVLSSIIAPERATDQYIHRLFVACASEDKKGVTFQNLIDCLSLLHPETADSNANWTIRLITGVAGDHFTFPEFLSFTQSVFSLNEGKAGYQDANKETILQRAQDKFAELDSDGDGLVTKEDMVRFFRGFDQEESPSDSATSSCYRTPIRHN